MTRARAREACATRRAATARAREACATRRAATAPCASMAHGRRVIAARSAMVGARRAFHDAWGQTRGEAERRMALGSARATPTPTLAPGYRSRDRACAG